MRGETLTRLIDKLRAEVGHSVNPAHGISARDWLVQALTRSQDELWEEYDWEHLNVKRDLQLVAGERFYNVPNDLTAERISEVWFRYGSRWVPTTYGIDDADYSVIDGDILDERTWPVRAWRFSEDPQDLAGNIDDQGMIEIWPTPPSSWDGTTGLLRLRGIRKMRPMVADSDRSELDGTLIVLSAAVDILTREDEKDAGLKLERLNRLRTRLQGNSTNKQKVTSLVPEGDGQSAFGGTTRDLPEFVGRR